MAIRRLRCIFFTSARGSSRLTGMLSIAKNTFCDTSQVSSSSASSATTEMPATCRILMKIKRSASEASTSVASVCVCRTNQRLPCDSTAHAISTVIRKAPHSTRATFILPPYSSRAVKMPVLTWMPRRIRSW
ncbi:hypothetical protein FQZ97_1145480 [compost metagenome]